MCSGYPRTRKVSLNAMAWYQEAWNKGGGTLAILDRFYGKLSKTILAEFDLVLKEQSLIDNEQMLLNVYEWALRFPGNGFTDLISEEKLSKIEERTRFAGGEIVKLFGNGSAFYAPAQSAIEMAESYLRDKKRVIPCASLCNGEFGIDGYFIGVPTVIGLNGVEKILEFPLEEHEQKALNHTLDAVKKTVSETGL